MNQLTMSVLFISTILQSIYEESQASQPQGYIGCYPSSIANFENKTTTNVNDGKFCIGVCKSSGYRFAATKGLFCNCAERTIYNTYENETGCIYPCPGRVTEHCGGHDSMSLYDTLCTERSHMECHNNFRMKNKKTSSKIDVIHLPEVNFTNEYMGNNWTVSHTTQGSNSVGSPKIDISASVANWLQMTAGYIWLPVVIFVGCSSVLIVCLILRHMQMAKEANPSRRRDSAMYITQSSGQNVMSDSHYYQTLNHENSLNMESSSQMMTAGSSGGVLYITPVHSNGTDEYMVPVSSRTAEYVTLVDST